MAPKVTSSSNRSKRTSSKPVTKGQNPQRANRQSASNASVTNSASRARNGGARITNASQRLTTNSARVTGTQSSAPKALPPGRQGGALATTATRRDAAMSRQAAAAQGSQGTGVRIASGSAPKALPPASPRQPGTTRTEPTRRENAQYRQRLAADGSRSSTVRTGQPGKPAAGSTARSVRNVAGRAANALAAVGTGADAYNQARQRGETRGRSAAQAFSAAGGFAGGAKAGAMLPGGPLVKGIGSLALGLAGAQGALRATQGVQEMGKAASRRGQDPNPPRPGTFGPPSPRNNLYSTVAGRPVGQQAVMNGKPVSWDGYKWVPSRSVGPAGVAAMRGQAAPKPPRQSPDNQDTVTSQTYGSVGSGRGGGGDSYQGVAGRISSGVRGSAPMSGGSSGGGTAMPGVAASQSYRDGGKGLYQGSEAYRSAMKAKDPNSSGNPMLDRLRNDLASANFAAQRQETSGVGPVANGMQYANSVTRGNGTTGNGPVRDGAQFASSLGRTLPDVAPPPPRNARLADPGAPKPPTKKNEPKPRSTNTRSTRNR